jgi:hypothetical protein
VGVKAFAIAQKKSLTSPAPLSAGILVKVKKCRKNSTEHLLAKDNLKLEVGAT